MIFVTGGTGFLGHHLVPALIQQGWRVRVLTRHPQRQTWLERYTNQVEVVAGDVQHAATLYRAVRGCQHVIHAAGLFSMWGHARDFYATNVLGTQNLIRAAHAAEIERFIHISTAAVIGTPQLGQLVDENHPARPADAYQKSKLLAEHLVLDQVRQGDLDAVVLRPGAFYGPMGEYAFNRLFFTDPMRGILMQMDGGGYIIFPAYIGDVAQGIVKALHHGRTGEIYHIAGDYLSHRQAFDIICQEANIQWFRLNIPGWMGINFARLLTLISAITRQEPFYPVNLRSYVFNDWRVSSDKAKRDLGFIPTPFRDGVRRTIAWYRAGKPQTLPEWDSPMQLVAKR